MKRTFPRWSKQERHICPVHGAEMQLCDAKQPIFGAVSTLGIHGRRASRPIYRCPVAGCPRVASGPAEVTFTSRERQTHGLRGHYTEVE